MYTLKQLIMASPCIATNPDNPILPFGFVLAAKSWTWGSCKKILNRMYRVFIFIVKITKKINVGANIFATVISKISFNSVADGKPVGLLPLGGIIGQEPGVSVSTVRYKSTSREFISQLFRADNKASANVFFYTRAVREYYAIQKYLYRCLPQLLWLLHTSGQQVRESQNHSHSLRQI